MRQEYEISKMSTPSKTLPSIISIPTFVLFLFSSSVNNRRESHTQVGLETSYGAANISCHFSIVDGQEKKSAY